MWVKGQWTGFNTFTYTALNNNNKNKNSSFTDMLQVFQFNCNFVPFRYKKFPKLLRTHKK